MLSDSSPGSEDDALTCALPTPAALNPSSRSTEGTKNKPPVSAVEKSRMRSVLPGGSPMNMFLSMSSISPEVRA